MKRIDIVNLYANLKKCETLSGKCENITRFLYDVSRNLIIVESEVKSYQKISAPSKEYIEYDKARVELCKIYANKDDKGNPIIKNNSYDILDENGNYKQEFLSCLEELNKKDEQVIKDRERQLQEVEKFMEEESDTVLHKIKLENIPDDISKHVGLMKGILILIAL